jgi:hypothetical protein
MTRGPTYCSSSPFSRALRGQQDLQHHPKARQRAIGICQGDASAGHLMAFRPRLAIGGGARADAVQQGDEGVRVQRRAIRRRVANRVRGRGVGLGHGWAPCVHAEAATDKGGGRCEVRNPVFAKPAGTRPPRTARHSRPTDCQPAPRVMPAGKRLLQRTTGFRIPATCFRWHGRNTPGCARCQCSKADAVTTFNIFRIVAYGATGWSLAPQGCCRCRRCTPASVGIRPARP